jgi:DNA-directed RNA polymerase subunit RPC12/RpoP
MGVARTTFQRILYSARSKIAEVLVKGNALRIEGGAYVMASDKMLKCGTCGSKFAVPGYREQEGKELCCPGCGYRGHGFGRRSLKGGYRQQGDISDDDMEKPEDSEQNGE